MRIFLAALVLSSSLAFADDLTPAKAATIQRQRKAALDEVNKKYGNKKPSELTNDERRALISEQNEAVGKVLDKNGVSAKEFSKYEATSSTQDRQAAKAQGEAMDAEEKKAAEKKPAEAKGAAKNGTTVENGIIIERGEDKVRGK
jgi:hypothetical protein